MKNVTVTLDEKTAAWARVHAARNNLSLSRFLGDLLFKTMKEAREYETAMQRYLEKKPVVLKRSGTRYPTREEIYERGVR
jgi:hypothetical protein